LPKEIYQLASTYNNAARKDKANKLYQYIVETWPGNKYAILAQSSLAAGIHLNDELNLTEGIDMLLTDFSKHKDIRKALSGIVAKYCKAGSYEQAEQLCQYVIDNWHDDASVVISGKSQAATIHIAQSNDIAVQAVLDELIADFPGHLELPMAIFTIGEQYYDEAFRKENQSLVAEARDRFTKAIAVWERIIAELPEHGHTTAQAYNFAAICYRRIGEYDMAIEYFHTVADQYPDYEYAPYALFIIGRICETLMKASRLSHSEAYQGMQLGYGILISRYPDSEFAGRAQRQLQRFAWINQTTQIQGEDK
jgi:tetratricopeptide (TPR) repeat protein